MQSIYYNFLSFSPFIPLSVSPWLQVFLTRMDGTVNFYRGWDQYKNGFGHAAGEYWLGKQEANPRNTHYLTDHERQTPD